MMFCLSYLCGGIGFYGITWYLRMILILDHLVYDVLWRLVIEVILILDHLVSINTTWYLWRWFWCHNIHFVSSNHVKNMPKSKIGRKIFETKPPVPPQNWTEIYRYQYCHDGLNIFIAFPIWRLWKYLFFKNFLSHFGLWNENLKRLICSYYV